MASAKLITWVFRYNVKLAGTTGIEVLNTVGKTATYRQKNRRKAQNYIGSVHAAAMALWLSHAQGILLGSTCRVTSCL